MNDEDQADNPSLETTDFQSVRETLGKRFREERASQGISLDDVARDTRIPRNHLENIEKDYFETIPSEGYLKGFIRNYSRYLKLDVDEMLELLKNSGTHEQELVESNIEQSRAASRFFRDLQGGGVIIGLAIFALVLLCAAVAIWWFGFNPLGGNTDVSDSGETIEQQESQQDGQTGESIDDDSTENPVQSEIGASNVEQQSASSQSDLSTPSGPESTQSEEWSDDSWSALSSNGNGTEETVDPTDTGEGSVFDGILSSGSSGVENETEDTSQFSGTASATTFNSEGVQASEEDEEEQEAEHDLVILVEDDESWLKVIDETEAVLVQGVQSPGTRLTLNGEAPFEVEIGYVPAVRVFYRGKEQALDQYTSSSGDTAKLNLP